MNGALKYPDLTQMCRLCLKEGKGNIDIFANNEGKQLSVPVRIMACAGLEVQTGDGLPKCICTDCRYQLEKSFYLRKRAVWSDSKVRKHLRLLNMDKKSRVFAHDEDDEDELLFEDSIEFIRKQDEKRNYALIENQEKLRLEWQQELEEIKKTQLANMHKEVRERCGKLKKELWHEAKRRAREELEKEIRHKIRVECIDEIKEELREQCQEQLLNELQNFLHNKRERGNKSSNQIVTAVEKSALTSTTNQQRQDAVKTKNDGSNARKSLKRLSSPDNNSSTSIQTRLRRRVASARNEENDMKNIKHESLEVMTTADEAEDTEFNDEEHINDEELAQSNFYIVEANIDETSDGETLLASEDLEYSNVPDSAGDSAVYQIEANGEIQTIQKSNGDMLFFKLDNDTDSAEQMELVEFISLNPEKHSNTQKSTSTCSNTSAEKEQQKTPGFTKVTTRSQEAKNSSEDEKTTNTGVRPTDTPKTFKCDLCPMNFSTINTLNRHYRIHARCEKEGRIFECPECHVIFSCKSALNRHAILHTGERPFKCDECGKSFVQREILKRHQQVHTGERPYQCPHCPRNYTQKVNLQQHINHNHSKTASHRHPCHLCSKRFNHPSGLSRHLATHSGISYQCIECERNFGDRSSVKRHVLHVHMSAGASSDSANKLIKECTEKPTNE